MPESPTSHDSQNRPLALSTPALPRAPHAVPLGRWPPIEQWPARGWSLYSPSFVVRGPFAASSVKQRWTQHGLTLRLQ